MWVARLVVVSALILMTMARWLRDAGCTLGVILGEQFRYQVEHPAIPCRARVRAVGNRKGF